ncbi:hypothetical protein [Enterobacter sp. C2]|uniref:hypothetical protein n=1 Tax=Enterobacter sp. C2 TaxID=2870346 RepID=UPI001CA458B6|nr:hypothetical protein [Enterobacter sp. C2]
MNTTNDVYHACTAGREGECAKVAIKNYSNFGGGVAGAALAASLTTPVCLALGVPTVGIGTIACGVIVSAAGSSIGATVVGYAGQVTNYLIYGGN